MIDRNRRDGALIDLGLVLVALGGLFLLQQVFGFELWDFAWPFFIIIPGLLFFVGMVIGGPSAGPLAIPGSIITTVGLILLYQSTFNHFESWAYAWALIPVATGVGMIIGGSWSNNPAMVASGRRTAEVGLVLFAIGVIFFELILHISWISRSWLDSLVGPLALIGIGIYLILRRAYLVPSIPQPTIEPTESPYATETTTPPEPAPTPSTTPLAAPIASPASSAEASALEQEQMDDEHEVGAR